MNVKEIIPKLKEAVGKISPRGRKAIIIGGAAVLVFAVLLALIINRKDYTVLFSGVNSDEATEIVGKLQESAVDYQYKDNGDILVDKKQVDQIRAQLAQEGYPKSGFSYGVFIDNAGGMTTDSDKQTYKLYDLQNRISATITLFEGVKDAKVTIALGENKKYVLQDDSEQNQSSATAVVIMTDGGSPSKEQAVAIQHLVARSVAGLLIENVSVFDGNGQDVSPKTADSENSVGTAEEISKMVESQITAKVMNLLGAVYGIDNVRVAVKSKINMEKLIRETLTYSTPDKIDENDKTGLVEKESLSDRSSEGMAGDGGVPGAESNTDVTQYATQAGNSSYASSDSEREYAINQVKEQGQVPAGAVEDLTIAVTVNGNDLGTLSQTQIKSLIGNAAGIAVADQNDKITVVNAPFHYGEGGQPVTKTSRVDAVIQYAVQNPIMVAVIGGILLLLLILAAVMIAVSRRRRRRRRHELNEEREIPLVQIPSDKNPEITNIQNEKVQGLRDEVRNFTDQNPEISAQLLKSWLNGGEQNGS